MSYRRPAPLSVSGGKFLLLILGGVLLRLCVWRLLFSTDTQSNHQSLTAATRVVFETPMSSWTRAKEGVYLYRQGLDPYESGMVHTPPLLLLLTHVLIQTDTHTANLSSILFYIFCDIVAAWALKKAAYNLTPVVVPEEGGEKSEDSELVGVNPGGKTSAAIFAIYLLNPLTIITCAVKSSIVVEHCILSLMLSTCNIHLCVMLIPILSYLSIHNVYYIIPLFSILSCRMLSSKDQGWGNRAKSFAWCVMCLAGSTTVLIVSSYTMCGSWSFVGSVYGCVLNVCDLAPNMGLYWYFFMEMFEHFNNFFVYVLQLSPVVFLIPLGFKLSDKPHLLFYVVTMCIVVFKTYSSFGDVSVYCSLLPVFTHLFVFMRTTLFTVIAGLIACVMAPLMWRIWLVTFNPNFFYAITLVWNLAQIFLINDILYGYLRRQHALLYGVNPTDNKGKPLQVTLVSGEN